MKEQLEETHYFQIITSNRDRALWLQRVLPGGKSDHIRWTPVDEDRQKGISGTPIDLVRRISEFKAGEDYNVFGSNLGKVLDNLHQRGFTHLNRFTSDTIRVVYDDGAEIVQHKPTLEDLDRLPRVVSGKTAAVVTAITNLSVAFETMKPSIETAVTMAVFRYRHFSTEEFWDFVRQCSIGKMQGVSGGIPINTFPKNPLIEWDDGINVTFVQNGKSTDVAKGDIDPNPCVHGAFSVVLESILNSPGSSFPRRGDIYTG